jgi:hypothetical protein
MAKVEKREVEKPSNGNNINKLIVSRKASDEIYFTDLFYNDTLKQYFNLGHSKYAERPKGSSHGPAG